MTIESRNKILHSVLFNIFWAAVVYIQISNLEQGTLLLTAAALSFVALHFCFFAQNFGKELLFLTLAFFLGFAVESILSNSGVYYYGLVDNPGLTWPPPWIAALWLMFPLLVSHTLSFLKDYPIVGSAFFAVSTFGTYYLFGKKMDLIFFNPPLLQGFVSFSLFWYVLLRFLIRLKIRIGI